MRQEGGAEADEPGIVVERAQRFDHQTDPRYGAARLWLDKIIDPMETRDALITALEAVSLNPEVKEFKVGVLQT